MNWVGNGFCDDPVNILECNFDSGDCCPKQNSENSNWNKYCTECKCKEK